MNHLHLLLADEDERFLRSTRTMLEKRKLNVQSAGDKQQVQRILEQKLIDVMLLSVSLPVTDGLEVLRSVKHEHPLIEVIMLSPLAMAALAIEGIRLGAFDYLIKPCDISDLLTKAVDAHVRKQANQERIRKATIERIVSHPMAALE
ncbi:MAG: response regulator [Thermodesulfobacteriota bacterium]|nr:response regulator [Thermodesulfobacteriota bacterium]